VPCTPQTCNEEITLPNGTSYWINRAIFPGTSGVGIGGQDWVDGAGSSPSRAGPGLGANRQLPREVAGVDLLSFGLVWGSWWALRSRSLSSRA
jgi:hypothetical protein